MHNRRLISSHTKTYSTVLNTILAMALYPEIQRKAQEELDSVIGNRLPTVADRDSTPYLNALIREVLRWSPSVPMSKWLVLTYPSLF